MPFDAATTPVPGEPGTLRLTVTATNTGAAPALVGADRVKGVDVGIAASECDDPVRGPARGANQPVAMRLQHAADHPLGAALFEIEGVASLFMVDDFVTVMKAPDASWDKLVPEVQAVIERVLG